MSCQDVRTFFDAYMDKELDVANTLDFERHVAECGNCRAIYTQYQNLHDSVQAKLPYFAAPEQLTRKVVAQLRSAEGRERGPRRREWFPRWGGWAVAAAAALLVVFSLMLFQTARRSRNQQEVAEQVVSSHIRSLMANHLVDVSSSDQHNVKPWFNGKLDFAPVVKDLSSEGFPLAGGRLDYLDNRTVAALVYKRRQHTINMFIWPSAGSDSPQRTATLKGYNVVHGIRSHMAYWVVSDLNAAELKQFAGDVVK